jgi:hypothetical protein
LLWTFLAALVFSTALASSNLPPHKACGCSCQECCDGSGDCSGFCMRAHCGCAMTPDFQASCKQDGDCSLRVSVRGHVIARSKTVAGGFNRESCSPLDAYEARCVAAKCVANAKPNQVPVQLDVPGKPSWQDCTQISECVPTFVPCGCRWVAGSSKHKVPAALMACKTLCAQPKATPRAVCTNHRCALIP